MERIQGKVVWFNAAKGWGFIEVEGRKDVFVYWEAIDMEGFKTLNPGDQVEFAVIQGRQGPQADAVTVIQAAAQTANG